MFFDLSIPYIESPKTPQSATETLTLTRLKTLARVMELGYTAVAYDRTIKSHVILSDADCRVKIPLFSLQSLLSVVPNIAFSINFHRDLNGVSKTAPLRQYARVTVEANRGSIGMAFNGKTMGLLRSCYDLVAVKPLDQDAFDRACQGLDVDIIAVDFPLRFRLKLPMVEAAIKRGVYFEIKYANLIADHNIRRQMLSDARLLVNWTRGKNLIISSSATSVNDIRGPYDVANLASFLLGLSKERAKTAISGNCSSLIANTLRKKDYKEAIRVERILSDEQLNSKSDWFGNWKDWDPLSSGEGDLPPLDDISKLFSAVNKPPTNPPAIDFLSRGDIFSLKDHLSSSGKDPLVLGESAKLVACCKEPASDAATMLSSSTNDVEPLGLQLTNIEGKFLPSNMPNMSADNDEAALAVAISNNENLEGCNQDGMASDAIGNLSSDVPLKCCACKGKDGLVTPHLILTGSSAVDEISTVCMENVTDSDMPDVLADSEATTLTAAASNNEIIESSIQNNMGFNSLGILSPDTPRENCSFTSKDSLVSQDLNSTGAPTVDNTACIHDVKISDRSDGIVVANPTPRPVSESVDRVLSITGSHLSSNGCDAFPARSLEKVVQEEKTKETIVERERKGEAVLRDDAPPQMDSDFAEPSPSEGEGACLLLDTVPFDVGLLESKTQEREEVFVNSDAYMEEGYVEHENHNQRGPTTSVVCASYRIKSGKRRLKGRSYPAFPLTFRGLLKPMLFKKKSSQLRRRSRHCKDRL